MAYVYQIINKINGRKYIGSSRKNIVDLNYYGSGKLIIQAIKKYGINNFERKILWEGEGDARLMEQFHLLKVNAANNPLYYNLTNDSRGNSLHTNETKKTISEKLTGRKFTQEVCNKISKAKKGKPNSKKGKLDGSKPKVSEAHKGRISPNKGKGRKVNLYSIDNKFIKTYNSYNDLALDIGVNHETVRQCLIGKQKTLKNKKYYCKYK